MTLAGCTAVFMYFDVFILTVVFEAELSIINARGHLIWSSVSRRNKSHSATVRNQSQNQIKEWLENFFPDDPCLQHQSTISHPHVIWWLTLKCVCSAKLLGMMVQTVITHKFNRNHAWHAQPCYDQWKKFSNCNVLWLTIAADDNLSMNKKLIIVELDTSHKTWKMLSEISSSVSKLLTSDRKWHR